MPAQSLTKGEIYVYDNVWQDETIPYENTLSSVVCWADPSTGSDAFVEHVCIGLS